MTNRYDIIIVSRLGKPKVTDWQDPASVGTAFKTISMRIRGAKTELEEAGLETEGMVESTAKLREEIMALTGVDIMLNENEFKSTYAIMEELANKWQDLTDIQQASVTELIAGKRQGNIVSSLMTNFDIADKALKTSIDSSGSAMKEHEKWMESLEARLLRLKAAWQNLSQAFMSSDFLKGALDVVIKLVEGITELIDAIGVVPTLLGGFAIFKTLATGFTHRSAMSGLADVLDVLSIAFPSTSKGISTFITKLKGAGQVAKGSSTVFSGLSAVVGTLNPYAIAAAAAIGILGFAYFKAKKDAKELSEEVDKLTSEYKSQHEELINNKSNFEATAEKYAELSKGVDGLGRNVSLTTDEYAEYQSVVSEIANQVPSLVSGYDSQGNAILNCKGNVEELTAAYEKLIHAQNNEILSNSGDIEKDFKNKLIDLDTYNVGDKGMTTSVAKGLEEMYNNKGKYTSRDDVFDYVQENFKDKIGTFRKGVEYELEQAGIDTSDGVEAAIAETLKTNPEKIKSILDSFEAELDDAAESAKNIAQAVLSEAFDISDSKYSGMSDTMQDMVRQVVSGFDSEFYADLVTEGVNIEEYINGILDKFNNLSDSENVELETAFNLQTKFNNGDVSYGEYINGLKEAESFVNGLDLDDEVKEQILLSLNTEEVTKDYDALTKRLTEIATKDLIDLPHFSGKGDAIKLAEEEAKEFLNSLTASEYAVAVDLIANNEIDLSDFDIDSLRGYIEEQAKINEALTFKTDIEIDKTSLEAFNTALEESASAMGLSEESIDSLKSKYADLEGYNPNTLFEKTANGVKVNREELAKLEQKYNDLTKTEVQEHLDTLVDEYNKCTKAIDGNIDSNEKLELISKREKYAEQIEELAEYQAQLEGVTGAYQKWIDAQNAPEDYEGYEGIATSREDVEDEISRGFLGNATKEYIDLLSGEDLTGKDIDAYAEAWERLDEKVGSTSYSIHDFFTVNDDGDITSTGIDRFFEGMKKDFNGSVANFNEETGKWQYNFSQENLEKIQDEWGIGIEAIELMLEAAESAGYDIDWGGMFDDLDIDMSNFESVEAMISLAEKAQEEFNKIDGVKEVEFNFRTNSVEEATTEVEKARKAYVDLITNKDGSINLKAEGAEQMRFMLSTLITQKQQLSTPAIMKVDTSQIDKAKTDVIEVVDAAKTLQTAYENYEIAISTGVDVENAKKDLNSAIEGMKGTSVDVRADLKLPTDDELKTAKDSIGDIKVGATLDGTAIGNLTTKIQTECTPEVIAKVTGLDESVVASESHQVVYTAEHKDVDTFINSLSDISKKIIYSYTTEGKKPNPSDIERTITYKYKTKGDVPEAYGTSHANGSTSTGRAFVRGNWGIKGNGTALGGELGRKNLRPYTVMCIKKSI